MVESPHPLQNKHVQTFLIIIPLLFNLFIPLYAHKTLALLVLNHEWNHCCFPTITSFAQLEVSIPSHRQTGLESVNFHCCALFFIDAQQDLCTILFINTICEVAQSCLFATPWTVASQAPLSTGFSRQEYWSGLPFPSPGDLPIPGIKPGSPAL